jgi:hypothetical protein
LLNAKGVVLYLVMAPQCSSCDLKRELAGFPNWVHVVYPMVIELPDALIDRVVQGFPDSVMSPVVSFLSSTQPVRRLEACSLPKLSSALVAYREASGDTFFFDGLAF